jgi:predicted nucleic acid-binding protein
VSRPEPATVWVAEPPAVYAVRPPTVVDSSLVCAVLFDEIDRDAALQRLAGRMLYAPDLLDHEVVSVALKKRRAGWPAASIELALRDYDAYAIELRATDMPAQFALAERYALSAYDAAYLWLASDLKAPLATFDRKLGEAAQRHLSTLE